MNVLLDTNIIIYREKDKILNPSVMNLYKWMDKLKLEKFIHPLTIEEICKNKNEERDVILTKLDSYSTIESLINPDENFLFKVDKLTCNNHDVIDNKLLYYVYIGRMDYFITEDKKIIQKGNLLGLSDKVFNISGFIKKCTMENPSMQIYDHLSVKREKMGDCNLNDHFFDSLRNDYSSFNSWFQKKSESDCYICEDEHRNIQGFLFLKIELEDENYSNITPTFLPKKRLKIGTFKVVSTGYRLGERFIKIVFDNALINHVDEIYVTLFEKRTELFALKTLFSKWGFMEFGVKQTDNGQEIVLVKKLKEYNQSLSIIQNYPNLKNDCKKYILPIEPRYHTELFPDAQLVTEKNTYFIDQKAYRYALQKVYISFSSKALEAKPGDRFIIYRNGENGTIKRYKSVLTGIGIVCSIKSNFNNLEEFLNECKNRTVFKKEELEEFWKSKKNSLYVINFIYRGAFKSRPPLEYLYNIGAVSEPSGPRPFTCISNEQYNSIVVKGKGLI